MRREDKAAPEGSRVGAQTKDGVKNQAAPNWSDLASRDQTWQILAALADIANNRGKNVAQVSIRSGGKFLQYFLDKCGHLKVAPGETECSLSRHWSEEPGPAGGQPGVAGLESDWWGDGEAG